MASNPNTVLDDICAAVGYTATRAIVAWYHGRRMWVPTEARPTHPLATLIGMPCLRALVRRFPGVMFKIPTLSRDQALLRVRLIADGVVAGQDDAALSRAHGVTSERVGQVRRAMLSNGLIGYARLEVEPENF